MGFFFGRYVDNRVTVYSHSLTLINTVLCLQDEEQVKEKKNRKDYWLHDGIVVKVLTKKLGDKYYKKKGFIQVRVFLILVDIFNK